MKNSPFLNLLTEENIKKINIDSSLIPIFKIVITKIDAYFKKNNLMDAKDWDAYLKRFLLSKGAEQLTIKLVKDSVESIGGNYSRMGRVMIVHPLKNGNMNNLCLSFCHEFIHFLVMADINNLDDRFSDSQILNEGMTEYLATLIMDSKTFSSYLREIGMAKFYSLINQSKNPFFYFLNDKFTPNYDNQTVTSIIRSSMRYDNDSSLNFALKIQREIINHSLDNFTIKSFVDFVYLLTIINNRPYFDYQYIDNIFEVIINKYLMIMNLKEEDKEILKKKLKYFCWLLNKAQLYGQTEVAEYLLGDLYIAFDKNGKWCNQIILSGDKIPAGIHPDQNKGVIIVTNDDKYYTIFIKDMKCRNWQAIFDVYYQSFRNEINFLETLNLNNMNR